MKTRSYLLPGGLTISAIAMSAGLALGDGQTPPPSLDCSTSLRVDGQFLYASTTVRGGRSATQAAEVLVNSEVVDGTTEGLDVETIDRSETESTATATDSDGNVRLVVALEGSDADGWRPERLEMCE